MKNQGISIMGIIVFLGLIALIVWGLDYIITQDFVTVRTPITVVSDNNINTPPASTVAQNALSTTTSTSTQTSQTTQAAPTATSTPAKTPTQTTPTTNPTSSDLTVTFTDKGFSPASLTIKKGQTVTFVNNSSDKMWVAANPFPTSSEYPTFNEKSGVDSGASWSFTFDKTGVWFYHNHYHPAQGAKIVVNAK